MFNLFFKNGHVYSLAATGIKMREQTFEARHLAEKQMYKMIGKMGLRIVKVYDDKHDKTYICNNNVRFYITRW